jgi:hypothetical protein
VLVLLLPTRLEDFALREPVEALLRDRPGEVVVVDPPRTSYRSLARIPDAVGVTVVTKQAKRLRKRLPAEPRAVAIFDPVQYPLARSLLAIVRTCELWYGATAEPGDRRLAELDLLARERAALTFGEDLGPLREKLSAL